MCGFFAIYSPEVFTESKYVLEKMLDSLSHRGPDSHSYFASSDGRFVSGFVQLSTNNAYTIKQPFSQGSKTLLLNGDIYFCQKQGNYISDVEYLMSQIQKYGFSDLKAFNGEYAFVAYDNLKKSLLIGRDSFGKRPLYYWTNNKKYIFASEIRTILLHPEVELSINTNHVYRQLLRYDSTVETFYKGIFMFSIDTFQEITPQKIDKNKLHSLRAEVKSKDSFEEIKEKTSFLINQSVDRRISKRFNTGIFLSGGLDSSILAYESSVNNSSHITCYSIRFEGREFDESKYARMVSDHLGLKYQECFVSDEDLINYFPQANLRCEHLVQQIDGTGKYILSKMAGDNNERIVLTGEGADEMFLGYPSFLIAKVLEKGKINEVLTNLKKTETARIGGDLLDSTHNGWETIFNQLGFDLLPIMSMFRS